VDDDERIPPGNAGTNRTIQIDALTDVQLVDQVADGDDGESDEAPVAVSAPPPLPPKRTVEPRSTGRTVMLTLVAVAAGGLFAFAIVHFVLTPAPPPAPAEVAAPETPRVHRVQLDEELVIHAPSPDP
jgi:hypothetical protein